MGVFIAAVQALGSNFHRCWEVRLRHWFAGLALVDVAWSRPVMAT